METEIKLKFNDKDSLYNVALSDWFRRLIDNGTESKPVLLENLYLDTHDLKITNRTGMVRSRHCLSDTEEYTEFTVKFGGGTESGLHRRYEWNLRSDSNTFSIASFKEQVKEDDPSAYLDMVFEGLTDEDLMVICSNSFYRTVYDLLYGDSTVEACLDYGSIISSDGSRSEEICELELELKSGEVDDLKKLAGSIIALTGCVPFDATKYGRTLAMANGGK